MGDPAFNWEIVIGASSAIIALSALLFSICSFRKQQRRADVYAKAAVKPFLSIKSKKYIDLKSIRLCNDGVGPAIIKKATFQYKGGKPTNRIVELFSLGNIVYDSFTNIPENKVLAASESITLVELSLKNLMNQGLSEGESIKMLEKWQTQKSGIIAQIEYEDIYNNKMAELNETLN